ncbi:MAG: 3-phosphoserine/phosphohydroxythreonine transaminase [Lentisphaerae bacterium]|nr:3-phosphoserine/phosphohydroxythreonine transaminase [Lentisphaerota bacterium]
MKVYNFSAGPAMLPEDVMKIAQAEFCDFKESGSGLIELSHRGKQFTEVIERAVANVKELMNISDDYDVMFIQGGASMQFAMLAMNLLNGKTADYADTGVWSNKAYKEAANLGNARIVCSSKADKYAYIPEFSSWEATPADAAYLHITSNNTVAGTQYRTFPKVDVPLIADMSSDIMSRVVNVNDFGMIYAGAQKNLGPSGMAVVIMRKDLQERTPANLPTMLKYSTYSENNSLYNTPPTFAIYLLALVTDWFKAQGGIAAIEKLNDAKADKLYGYLDSTDFYTTPVQKESRSRMNVVWRLPSEELDAQFVKEATAAGLTSLKGHRIVGGCRASIYNAMPMAGVDALIDFMREFEKRNG